MNKTHQEQLRRLDQEYKKLEEAGKRLDKISRELDEGLRKFKSPKKSEIYIYGIAYQFSSYKQILDLISEFALEGNEGNGKNKSSS